MCPAEATTELGSNVPTSGGGSTGLRLTVRASVPWTHARGDSGVGLSLTGGPCVMVDIVDCGADWTPRIVGMLSALSRTDTAQSARRHTGCQVVAK